MKTSDSNSFASSMPSLFQIAAFFEDFFPARGFQQSAASVRHLPIADFMVNPENLMRFLTSDKSGEPVIAEPPPKSPSPSPAKRPARNVPAKKITTPSPGKANGSSSGAGNSSPDLTKKVEFKLKSLSARSVKLAGDFTEWDKRPVEMNHADGVWSAVVSLVPGRYSYRFIVDGKWCNDPVSGQRVPNPFGTENSVIHVA